jgi:hypothetical protein
LVLVAFVPLKDVATLAKYLTKNVVEPANSIRQIQQTASSSALKPIDCTNKDDTNRSLKPSASIGSLLEKNLANKIPNMWSIRPKNLVRLLTNEILTKQHL